MLGDLDSTRTDRLIRDRLGHEPASTDVFCARLPPGRQVALPLPRDATRTEQLGDAVTKLAGCGDAASIVLVRLNPFGSVGDVPRRPMTGVDLSGTPRDIAARALHTAQDVAVRRRAEAGTPVPVAPPAGPTLEDLADHDLRRAERIGLLVAFLVLVAVIRSLVASFVPLLLGFAAVAVALGLTTLVGGIARPPSYVVSMTTMIGLAVGIDYALFVIQRYREELRAGHPAEVAIESAAATAIRTVLSSGTTVVLALAGMLLIPVAAFRSITLGAMTVVVAGMLAAMTLLPALLRLLGRRLEWPSRVRSGRSRGGPRQTVLTVIGNAVVRHPIVCLVLVAAVLGPLNVQAFAMRRDLTVHGLTRSTSTLGAAGPTVGDQVTEAVSSLVEIAIDRRRSPAVSSGIERLVTALGRDQAFAPVVLVQWNRAEDLAIVSALLVTGSDTADSTAAIARLRDEVIPRALASVPAEAALAGPAATKADVLHLLAVWQPRVKAVVLALSFLLLLLTFRSVVVPLNAIALNLLTVGAATGLLVLVFQEGYGADAFGFTRVPAIEAWVPVFLFCIVFGLSMDYHIFLLSRIREGYDRTGDHDASLIDGIRSTSGVITGAALIMVIVFGSFAAGPLLMLQQIGFGLAVAVFLDATVVRSVLVPASMALLGAWNWYLPRWLRWLPDLRVEGTALPQPTVAPEPTGD